MNRGYALIIAAFGASAVIAATVLLPTSNAVAQTGANQPHMQSALTSLLTARTELQNAVHNKVGHRVTALQLVNQAINETQLGMAEAN
jgi:hypothetical protein